MSENYEIAKLFAKGEIKGWAEVENPGLVKEQFNLLGGSFRNFQIVGQSRATNGGKMFLHQVVRKVLGEDTVNYPQQVGDCVAHGAKNATEYLTCAQIVQVATQQTEVSTADFIQSARIKWRPVFPPYYYGTGRVYVGGNRLRGDGSLGSWQAKAVMEYGTLFSDHDGVPKYSGSVARDFGRNKSSLDRWLDVAKEFPVKTTALIRRWEDFVAAIVNGYPITLASNVGFTMGPQADGFHRRSGSWAHQMCGVGVDDNSRDPYALILNSWGNVHGQLKDFETGENLPVGVLRVRRADVERILNAGDSYAFSQFEGFPEQKLDKALFMLV